jgi:type II secretory pathway component PulF
LFDAIVIGLSVTVLSQAMLAALARDATRWLALGWRLSLQRRSKLFRQFFEQVFYTLFVWQNDAGLDYVSGAKDLTSLIDALSYRRAVARYRQLIMRGGAVAGALQSADLMVPGELAQVIDVGEQSGRLVPALQHYLLAQGARLDRIADSMFTWLPRIYYLVVVAIAVGFVI